MISAKEEGRWAYRTYLEVINITDPVDPDACGEAREFFGYDATFTNDAEICDNVKQLRNTRNFDQLDSFYGQGSSGDGDDDGGGGGDDGGAAGDDFDFPDEFEATELSIEFTAEAIFTKTIDEPDRGTSLPMVLLCLYLHQ
jgi:hypothetical protein